MRQATETEISGLTFWLQFGFLKTEPKFGFRTSLHISVHITEYYNVVHNTAQNSSDNVPTNILQTVIIAVYWSLEGMGCAFS